LISRRISNVIEENRINMGLIPPARGLIYDINGVVPADNAQHYTITMTQGDVDEILARLNRLCRP
jgi:penicillin-binding protein 2